MGARLTLAVAWLLAVALVAPTVPGAEQTPPPPTETAAAPPELEPPPPDPEPPAVPKPVEQVPSEPPEAVQQPPASPRAQPPDTGAAVGDEQQPAARKAPAARPRAFAAAPGAVTIEDFSFGPTSVTVGVGESVTWRNTGASDHTATATDGSFDTGLLARGESGSATFSEAGTFSYLCTPHPFMKGTVQVVAAQSGGGSGDDGADDGSAGLTGTGTSDGDPAAGSLPDTGTEPLWLAVAGLGLLLIGATGRRRSLP